MPRPDAAAVTDAEEVPSVVTMTFPSTSAPPAAPVWNTSPVFSHLPTTSADG